MRGSPVRRLVIASGLVLALGGCSSVGGFFTELGKELSGTEQQQAALPVVPMAGAGNAAPTTQTAANIQAEPQAAAPAQPAPQATAAQRQVPQTLTPQTATPQTGAPQAVAPQAMQAQPQPLTQPSAKVAARAADRPVPPIVRRLATLEYLHRNKLIDDADYQARRAANVGALLPLTQGDRLAADPDSPAPRPEDVVDRLRRLRDFSQRGLISQADYQREHKAILDALLPVQGGRRTAPPPQELDGDEATRRLETLDRWKEADLITDEELEAERKAILAAMNRSITRFKAPPPKASAAGSSKGNSNAPIPLNTALPTPRPKTVGGDAGSGNYAAAALDFEESIKIHLASFRDRNSAEKGWQELKKRYPVDLAGLMVEIRPVNLGPKRGVYQRVLAGPFADKAEAARTCKRIKAKGGYCAPMY